MAKKISIDLPSEQINLTDISVSITATQVNLAVNKTGTGGKFSISGYIADEKEIDTFINQINKQAA